MSCVVYVWGPHGGMVGHAAMHAGATYISWWPNLDLYAQYGNSQPVPGQANTWDTDVNDAVRGEGRAPEYRSPPLGGLDEAAIAGWWDTFRTQNSSRWTMDSTNCAWVVLAALEKGGADSDWIFANFIKRLYYPPSPVDCRTAAELIAGRKDGALNTISRYVQGQILNPLANATTYVQAINLK